MRNFGARIFRLFEVQRIDECFAALALEFERSLGQRTVFADVREFLEKLPRNEEFLAELAAQILQSGRRVDGVPVVSDFAPEIADLGHDDLSPVGRGLERRIMPEFREEPFPRAEKAPLEVFETENGLGRFAAIAKPPGQEDAVSRYLVNVAVVFLAAVREEPVIFLHETAVFDVSHFLGEARGIPQIDEHEYQSDLFRFLRFSEERVDENVRPEFFVDGADECDEKSRQDSVNGERPDVRIAESPLQTFKPAFVDEGSVPIPVHHQNANGNVDENRRREIAKADENRGGNRSRIAVVAQDDDVVDAVGKPGQNGELERGQVKSRVGSPGRSVKMEKEKEETEKNPASDVKRDGFYLSFLKSGTEELHRASM